ncbi:structural constituent of ribosome [Branchiostoma belcheri]|nr:structural constituent of ribosome [Branchiostoma belcheri]
MAALIQNMRSCLVVGKSCSFTWHPKMLARSCMTSVQTIPSVDVEQEKKPLYPPVVPSLTSNSEVAKKYKRQLIRQKIASLSSPKDKITALLQQNRKAYMLYALGRRYNVHAYQQWVTKTTVVKQLPESITDVTLDDRFEQVKSQVMDLILQERLYMKRNDKKWREPYRFGVVFTKELARLLTTAVSGGAPHLATANIIHDPKVEYCWPHTEYWCQLLDQPDIQILTQHPLPQYCPMDSDASIDGEIPVYEWSPSHLAIFERTRKRTIFPGFKIESPTQCGHTQFRVFSKDISREKFQQDLHRDKTGDQLELRIMGAAVMGFTWYQDLQYPITSQAILTDGRYFTFGCYQLNTLSLQQEDNPLRNVLFYQDSQPLYDDVQDGQVVGFNDNVLRTLLQVLGNRTEPLQVEWGPEPVPFNPPTRFNYHLEDTQENIFFKQMYAPHLRKDLSEKRVVRKLKNFKDHRLGKNIGSNVKDIYQLDSNPSVKKFKGED